MSVERALDTYRKALAKVCRFENELAELWEHSQNAEGKERTRILKQRKRVIEQWSKVSQERNCAQTQLEQALITEIGEETRDG